METRSNKIYAASYIIIRKDHEILLMRRYNTGYKDGEYTLPAGHVDEGELPAYTATRETLEEVDIKVNKLKCVHSMYRVVEGGRTYVDYYFEATDWSGNPKVVESNKCDEVDWFSIDCLPHNTLPHVVTVLGHISKKVYFSEIKDDIEE